MIRIIKRLFVIFSFLLLLPNSVFSQDDTQNLTFIPKTYASIRPGFYRDNAGEVADRYGGMWGFWKSSPVFSVNSHLYI